MLSPIQQNVAAGSGLSYKFQRLRERIRAAVASGELEGKLPGERALAKRFNVNAKTLSKALTDLAAEGLLDRSIGRGTYVKGSAPVTASQSGRWIIFCTPAQANSSLVEAIKAVGPDVHVHDERQWDLRPSFLQPFTGAISLDSQVPEPFLRDLIVRNVDVVTVDYTPSVFSMHAVLDDTFTNAARLARALLMDGHRRFVVVEGCDDHQVAKAARETINRLAPDATIDVISPDEVASVDLTFGGSVSFLCESLQAAASVRARVGNFPGASIWAVGCTGANGESAGCFTEEQHKVDSIVSLLKEPPARPATVWLTGEFVTPREGYANSSHRPSHAHLVGAGMNS